MDACVVRLSYFYVNLQANFVGNNLMTLGGATICLMFSLKNGRNILQLQMFEYNLKNGIKQKRGRPKNTVKKKNIAKHYKKTLLASDDVHFLYQSII